MPLAMPAGTGLTRARIAEHRPRVAVPAGHPLAGRPAVAPGPAAGGAAHVVDLDPPVHVPVHALWPAHTTCPGRDLFLSRTEAVGGSGSLAE
ncbi:hypothetical protein ACFVSX_15475 [Streptomyces rubiginosohelvolus]|uniref:hypothetical protein n=1 Tax=Streptomyces rubiginosohelvolus TaxID=67362 RepID=UPI0036DD7DF2